MQPVKFLLKILFFHLLPFVLSFFIGLLLISFIVVAVALDPYDTNWIISLLFLTSPFIFLGIIAFFVWSFGRMAVLSGVQTPSQGWILVVGVLVILSLIVLMVMDFVLSTQRAEKII